MIHAEPFKKAENIIWLASYPKSGNTWLRIFLNNLLSKEQQPVDINALYETGTIASARTVFDQMMGIDSSDLTREEIDYYLPAAHQLHAQQLEKKEFIKVHNAFTKNTEGKWIIPLSATYKVIYLVRNPLDVCVSFAHHSGHSDFDRTIKQMGNHQMTLAKSNRKQSNQLHQHMGSWSDHVQSWRSVPAEKHLTIRYEDMKQFPQATFTKIVRFADLKYSEEEVTTALEYSKMEKLQQLEEEGGFKENVHRSTPFFRKGKIGSWREELSEKQATKLVEQHRELMLELNYLDAQGTLLI